MPPLSSKYALTPDQRINPNLTQWQLYQLGLQRIIKFCKVNNLKYPTVTDVPKKNWHFDACAYWRPDTEGNSKHSRTGISICLDKCARIAPVENCSNWNWPGCTIDREPYGVLAHEIGHYMDWSVGEKKWSYGSEYCEQVMKASGEDKLTSYCPDPSEWFAEMCRLFITNHALLMLVRPKTHALLLEKFIPVSNDDWLVELGDVPPRIKLSQERKMV